MRFLTSGLIASVFLGACATSTGGSSDVEDTVYVGFTSAGDGAMTQKTRGFSCPAELNGLTRTRAELIGDDGRDAFCNYVDDADRIFTVYLSDFPEFSLQTYFEASMRDTGTAMERAGYTADEDLTETCESSSIDAASLLQGLANMKENTVHVGTDPAVVFKSPGKLSILTLKEVEPGRFLKFRYSLPGSTEEDTELACDFLRQRSLSHDREIKMATGYEVSDQEKMWELLDEIAAKKPEE